jgi:hypothetical protein
MILPDIDLEYGVLSTIADNKSIFYVGTQVVIDEGIKRFYDMLDRQGNILVGKPMIYDYLYYDGNILYLIFYKSLGKLEYLEYCYEKKVGKNA